MKNFGLSKKLYTFSAALIFFLTVLAMVSWSQLGIVGELARDAGLVKARQLELISSTELSVTKVLLQIRQALLFQDADKINAALKEIAAERANITKNDNEFLVALPTEKAKVEFQIWLDMQKVTWPVVIENMDLVAKNQTQEGLGFLSARTIPALAKMQDWLNTERTRQAKYLTDEVAQIESSAHKTALQLVVLTFCIGVGLLGFSWYISKLLNRRIATSQSVAELVRDGDLYTRHADGTNDEFTPLLAALAAMQDSLATVVGTVRENAEFVATASAEIAQGNVDLSRRTESQASALEEITASMAALGTTAQQNVQNASEANRLAVNASGIATEGGDVVAKVVSTMKTINESSKEIAVIVSVIDGIAFQTNILALNAAVEAARAGEQGRGFAVVATEVRNLAHRSAEAAKQIKALIETSVQRVEQGVVLADDAGQTMSRVVTSIQDVVTIMQEISASGAEQGESVEQVGRAILEMDATTQQNAALVEESTAAAENLKIQSQQLVSGVSVFRLGAGETVRTSVASEEFSQPAQSKKPLRLLTTGPMRTA